MGIAPESDSVFGLTAKGSVYAYYNTLDGACAFEPEPEPGVANSSKKKGKPAGNSFRPTK